MNIDCGRERTAATSRRVRAAGVLALMSSMTACVPPAAVYQARAAVADSLARAAIAQERALDPTSLPATAIGIPPLAVLTADTTYASLGHGLAALLAADLAVSKSITVVERLRLDAVLRELDLTASGRVDTLTASRVGRLVGARRVIIGSIDVRSGGAMRIDTYVADATRGAITASLAGGGTLAQLFEAEEELAFRLFDALGVSLTPAERRAVEQRPTKSLAAFLAFSRGAQAEAAGNYSAAATAYSHSMRIDPGFRPAAQRAALIQGTADPIAGAGSVLERTASVSTDLVNRPAPVVIGTGVDAPAVARTQIVTFIVNIRVP